jgi:hypothetical protein
MEALGSAATLLVLLLFLKWVGEAVATVLYHVFTEPVDK